MGKADEGVGCRAYFQASPVGWIYCANRGQGSGVRDQPPLHGGVAWSTVDYISSVREPREKLTGDGRSIVLDCQKVGCTAVDSWTP
jgi:hypothetical protein